MTQGAPNWSLCVYVPTLFFHLDVADAVGPRPGLLQFEPEDLLNLLAGVRSGKQLIGNRADLLVTRRAPGQRGCTEQRKDHKRADTPDASHS